MNLSVPALIFIIFGVSLAIFRSQASQAAVEWNYKLFGVRFNEKGYEISFLVAGVFFVVMGVVTLLRIVEFR